MARNYLLLRAQASGRKGSPLDLLLEALANRIARAQSYFSARTFISAPPRGFGARLVGRTMADTAPVHNALVDRQFAAAGRAPGGEVPSGASAPDGGDAAYRRAAALAELVYDGLGTEKLGLLLADLMGRFAGRTYAVEEFRAAVRRLDAPLAEVLTERLRSPALPGFVHSPLEVVRVADDARGRPRYLSRLHVRNDERTTGVVRLLLYTQGDPMGMATAHTSELIHLAGGDAVEIELATPDPSIVAYLHTFLSRNRQVVDVRPPRHDSIPQVADEPAGVRPSTWRPPALDGLVIDDLDAGFTVRSVGEAVRGVRALAAESKRADTLANVWWNAPVGRWGRHPVERGWGKYRATVVAVANGDGREEAVFAAVLPAAGRWRLHYHVPSEHGLAGIGSYEHRRWLGLLERHAQDADFRLRDAGTYRMRLAAGDDEFDIPFDAARARYGWHPLGEFDLAAGDVSLAVSSRSDGPVVVADAVWFQPLRAAADPR